MRPAYSTHRVERNPLVLKPATKVVPTGAAAPADDTNVRDTRRPTNRGRLLPGLITLLLSVVINFLLIQAAVEYDKQVASPPPPPPPSPPSHPLPPSPQPKPKLKARREHGSGASGASV